MNNRLHGLALFIDFSKAFDTIDHSEIVKSLYRVGVRGPYLKWFNSYLQNRYLSVKALNTFSGLKHVNCGVPQGSQLGPIIFITYIDQLLRNIKNSYVWAYADDILIMSVHKEIKTAEQYLQNDFKHFSKFAHDKQLIINETKTALMHFCPKNMKYDGNILIKWHNCECLHNQNACNCPSISLVDQTKYLGLIVDRRLTWKEHIASVTRKLNPCIAMMYRLQNKVPISIKFTVYKALFESILQYGVSIWGNAAATHLNSIDSFQKRCLKVLFRDLNCEQGLGYNVKEGIGLVSISNQLTVRGFYALKTIVNNFNSNEHKRVNIRLRNTRNCEQYFVPTPRTDYGKRLPEYIVPRLYNMLPDYIRLELGYNIFKRAVTGWLIQLGPGPGIVQ